MIRASQSIRLKKGEKFVIEPMCCIHLGNVGHDEDKFSERVNAIMDDPNRYTVLMGDLHDAIYPSANEKRYDPDTIDARYWPPQNGYNHLEEIFKPMADAGKILGVSEGNHDRALWKRFGHNYIKQFSDNLDVPYLGIVWFLKLRFPNDKSWVINGAHGRFGGRRFGGNINRIEDMSSGYDADIYLRGHTHQMGYSKRRIETFDGYRTKYFAAVGSFLDGFKDGATSYAEEFDLLPLPTGTISFSIDPWKGKVDFYS